MTIRFASVSDIPLINRLAHKIWYPTYNEILPAEQISFMLEQMYAPAALSHQLSQGHIFVIAETENEPMGFASYSIEQGSSTLRIHKLYILPSKQGRGVGTSLLNFIEGEALRKGAAELELNVNRSNPAFKFYSKHGFSIEEIVDIPYFDYVLNDYILKRRLR